jgi:hypothetical protein
MSFVRKDNASLSLQKDQNTVMLIVRIYKTRSNVLTKKECLLIKINFKSIFKIVQESEISKNKKIVFGIIRI